VAGATHRTTEGASTAIRQLGSAGDMHVGAVFSTLSLEPHATSRLAASTNPMQEDVLFTMVSWTRVVQAERQPKMRRTPQTSADPTLSGCADPAHLGKTCSGPRVLLSTARL